MAEFKIECISCNNSLSFTEDMLDQEVECPVCQTPLLLSSPPAELIDEAPSDNYDKKKTLVEHHVTIPIINAPKKTEQITDIRLMTKDAKSELDKRFESQEAEKQEDPTTPQPPSKGAKKGGLAGFFSNLFSK